MHFYVLYYVDKSKRGVYSAADIKFFIDNYLTSDRYHYDQIREILLG